MNPATHRGSPLWVSQKGRCHYCDVLMISPVEIVTHPHRVATRDHKRPRARGGHRVPDNIVLACYRCNHFKGDMPYEVFVTLRLWEKKGDSRTDALLAAMGWTQSGGSWHPPRVIWDTGSD